jgi:hypothetical protein
MTFTIRRGPERRAFFRPDDVRRFAAKLLVAHSGLTQRDCAAWLGVRAGSAVGYQMELAARELAGNKDLARQMVRVAARFTK